MRLRGGNVWVAAGAAVAAALLIMACVLLQGGISRLDQASAQLDATKRHLENYYKKDPFPSLKNVNVEQRNVATLEGKSEALLGLLRKHRLPRGEPSPSRFMVLLGERRAHMLKMAVDAGTTVPPAFSFGFARYFEAGSGLPSPRNVPRLMQQLTVVEEIARALFEEKVLHISEISRELFEGKTVTAGSASDTGKDQAGEGELFEKLHFSVRFRSKEASLLAILNRLATHDLFIVVSSLEAAKEGEDVKTVDDRRSPIKDLRRTVRPPSRTARVVSGPELEMPMSVKLAFDVYVFR